MWWHVAPKWGNVVMKLADWLKTQGMTYSDLARKLGRKPDTIRRICLPVDHPTQRHPSPDLMRQVFEATNGAVEPNDFCDFVPDAGDGSKPARVTESGDCGRAA